VPKPADHGRLLEMNDPSVSYRTLTELLDRSANDAAEREARARLETKKDAQGRYVLDWR